MKFSSTLQRSTAAILFIAAQYAWPAETPNLPALSPTEEASYALIADQVSLESFQALAPGLRRILGQLAVAPRKPMPYTPALCFSSGVPEDVVAHFNRTYYGGGGVEKFQPAVARWTTTATPGAGAAQGDPITLTYSFVPDGTIIPGDPGAGIPDQPSDLFAFLDGLYGGTVAWQARFHEVFTRWGDLLGVTYAFQSTDDGAAFPRGGVTPGAPGLLGVRGDIRIAGFFIDGEGGVNVFAFNYFPDSGDMVLDTGNPTFFGPDGGTDHGLRQVVAHEHGHGLGMPHVCPPDSTKLMEPFISLSYDGPQHDDILGGQRLYGDFNEPNDDFLGATDFGALVATSAFTRNVSIDGLSDLDFYRFTIGPNQLLNIFMAPSGATYSSGPQGAGTCDPGPLFDTVTLSDLAVSLLDSDGTTILATADNEAAGRTEFINNFLISDPGTYYLKVSPGAGGMDFIQLYSLAVTVEAGPPPPPEVRFALGAYSVGEGAGARTISAILSEAPGANVSVAYATSDGTATAAEGDYTPASGTLTFGPSDTIMNFSIAITDDTRIEPDETILLTLSNPTGGLALGNPMTATLTIEDNDVFGGRADLPVGGALGFGLLLGALAVIGVLRLPGRQEPAQRARLRWREPNLSKRGARKKPGPGISIGVKNL